ncbi:hypothetical protein T484DRAFT_1741031 [Baffinella frigidus]|nr:hypothetical protein T484DRAFT_1741031 [Cryptophyta sp. CCMP2293]
MTVEHDGHRVHAELSVLPNGAENPAGQALHRDVPPRYVPATHPHPDSVQPNIMDAPPNRHLNPRWRRTPPDASGHRSEICWTRINSLCWLSATQNVPEEHERLMLLGRNQTPPFNKSTACTKHGQPIRVGWRDPSDRRMPTRRSRQ